MYRLILSLQQDVARLDNHSCPICNVVFIWRKATTREAKIGELMNKSRFSKEKNTAMWQVFRSKLRGNHGCVPVSGVARCGMIPKLKKVMTVNAVAERKQPTTAISQIRLASPEATYFARSSSKLPKLCHPRL